MEAALPLAEIGRWKARAGEGAMRHAVCQVCGVPSTEDADSAKPAYLSLTLACFSAQVSPECKRRVVPSDVNARKILPSPCPSPHSQKQSSTSTPLEDSIPKRPMSSIPLTGDSQTDSDILAFIKARQSILQKQCLGSS
ncbi:hypothetical protein H8959_009727 [Pygathrix nigripes]